MTKKIQKKLGKLLEAVVSLRGLGIRPLDESGFENVKMLINKLQPFQTNFPLRRLGLDRDGGYLVPDDLEGISACFSAGVGNTYHFEKACFDLGMEIFMVDKSAKRPEKIPADYHFLSKFIGPFDDADFITLDSWVNEYLSDKQSDLLLQMDIESAEYISLLSLSDALLQQFRVIVIEFHSLQKLWEFEFFQMAKAVFEKLLLHHTCVHIHPNNYALPYELKGVAIPPVLEFTFLRNDRITQKSPATDFPHPLDFKNVKRLEDYALPEVWFKK
jgi:hypothetical protein